MGDSSTTFDNLTVGTNRFGDFTISNPIIPLRLDLHHTLTKQGIGEKRPLKQPQEITSIYQLEAKLASVSGSYIHAAAYELAQLKLHDQHNIYKIPEAVTGSLHKLMGVTAKENLVPWSEYAHKLMGNIKKTGERIFQTDEYKILEDWAQSIHQTPEPNLRLHAGFQQELAGKDKDYYKEIKIFYTLATALLAHHPWFQDSDFCILPEIGMYPRTKNIERVIQSLQEPHQMNMYELGITIKTLKNIDIFQALEVNQPEDIAITLYDILANGTDPSYAFLRINPILPILDLPLMQPSDDKEAEIQSQCHYLTCQLQNMTDDEFVLWINELCQNDTFRTQDIAPVTALYIIAHAQEEFQYFYGAPAHLDIHDPTIDLEKILELAKASIENSEKIAQFASPNQEFSTISYAGRADFLVISPNNNKQGNLDEQRKLFDEIIHAGRQLYNTGRQPNMRNRALMYFFDKATKVGVNINITELKTSLWTHVPDKPEPEHLREMTSYMYAWLSTVFGLRRTTNPAINPYYSHEDLQIDHMASALTNTSILYIGSYRTDSGITPETAHYYAQHEIDTKKTVNDMMNYFQIVSQALQVKNILRSHNTEKAVT